MADLVYYDSTDSTGQSQLVRGIAAVKFPNATIVDNAGDNESAIDSIIAALVADTYDNIVITTPTVETHATGQWIWTQVQSLIAKLVTANQGTNATGTFQSNANATECILAAGSSSVDNFYRYKIMVSAGTTATTRIISAYVGSTLTCTIASVTALTDTSTYIVYMTDNLWLVGETDGTDKSCQLAWEKMFTTNTTPLLVEYMNDVDALYEKRTTTAVSVATGILTDTGEFTIADYDDGEYYVAIESATLGGGQIHQIASNTADVLTLATDDGWDPLPTGTVVYQIVHRNLRPLWNIVLPYGIPTYMHRETDKATKEWQDMLDQYGDINDGNITFWQDLDKVYELVEKSTHIMDGVWSAVVS